MSTNSKIGFALVGCGRIARKHAEILSQGLVERGKLVAVCDVKPDRAEIFAEVFKAPAFTDMHEMMLQMGNQVDVISVLTESGNHAKHTIDLARYGKSILVEKPMALTLEDADLMVRRCDEARIKLFVVKQNRYNLPITKLREAMDQGRFGKLVMGTVRVRWRRDQHYYDQDAWRGTWAMDGGVFANQASHHIDMLEWFLGEPESVFAYSRTALVDIETEDTGIAIIRFRNGALGVVEATTAVRPRDLEGSISILGENGTVEIGGFALNQMKVWSFSEQRSEDLTVMQQHSENPPNVYGFGHVAYLQHVVACISDGSPALVDGLEGRKSLELITAIYELIETGQEVRLRFKPRKS